MKIYFCPVVYQGVSDRSERDRHRLMSETESFEFIAEARGSRYDFLIFLDFFFLFRQPTPTSPLSVVPPGAGPPHFFGIFLSVCDAFGVLPKVSNNKSGVQAIYSPPPNPGE